MTKGEKALKFASAPFKPTLITPSPSIDSMFLINIQRVKEHFS